MKPIAAIVVVCLALFAGVIGAAFVFSTPTDGRPDGSYDCCLGDK